MLLYYLRLSLTSLQRHRTLTLLMVFATSMGIGLFMTIMTIYYYMSANPIPHKSDYLYRIQLDTGNPNTVDDTVQTIPRQLTYLDATNLSQEAENQFSQAFMFGATAIVQPSEPDELPFQVPVRANTHEFFNLFDIPFKYGSGWSRDQDLESAPVVVISHKLNQRLFGGENSIGKTLEVSSASFQIIGVLDDWIMRPKAYDLNTGPFDPPADIFTPFTKVSEMQLPTRGSTSCWKPLPSTEYSDFLASECTWIQGWVQLNDSSQKLEYESFLTAYIDQQKLLGRFERPNRIKLTALVDWLKFREATPPIVVVLLVSSLMFLLVCQCNTLSLLMAKLLSGAKEIGIRRALGANRVSVFTQIGVEALVVGVLGSILGLLLALGGIEAIVYSLRDEEGIDEFFKLDINLIAIGISTAVLSTLTVALYPMYRASQLPIASQLKTN